MVAGTVSGTLETTIESQSLAAAALGGSSRTNVTVRAATWRIAEVTRHLASSPLHPSLARIYAD
jgi:hypothetical protein